MEIRALATVGLFVAAAIAQAPPPFADLILPNGTAGAINSAFGQTITVRDGATWHAFSAAIGSWQSLTLLGTNTVQTLENLAYVREPGAVVAWSAWRGKFVAQPLANGAAILPTALGDDVLAAVDGNQLHTFSAFTGTWTTRTLPPNTTVLPRHQTVLLYSDQVAGGLDPYRDQWHDIALTSQPYANQVNGHAAVLAEGTDLHGFSAHRGQWTTISNPIASTVLAAGRDFGLAYGNGLAIGYSSITGTFAAQAAVGGTTQALPGFALTDTPGGAYAYSAATGYWTLLPALSDYVSGGGDIALFTVPNPLQPVAVYNAISGQFATYTQPVQTVTNSLALSIPASGSASVYSAFTGLWHGLSTTITNPNSNWFDLCGIVRPATGPLTFHARSGAVQPIPASTTPAALLTGHSSAAYLVASAGLSSRVYDSRTDRWLDVPPGLGVRSLSRHVALFATGTAAAAYSAASGQLAPTTLPEPVITTLAGPTVAAFRTANHFVAFAALPDNCSPFGWPESAAAIGLFTTYHHQLRLPVGAIALLGIGRKAAAPLPVPPFGDLWLDPAEFVSILALPPSSEFRQTFALPIPALPTLHNTEWFVQSLVLPVTGSGYFTAPNQFRIR